MVKKAQNLNTSKFNATKPYNGLPPLPSARVLETVPVLRKCVGASRALAGLKEAARLIPNQDVLINSIPLREARDSSAIENIVTTNDTLFKFANADPEKADDATKEALRYRTALMQGFKDVQERPLSTRTAVLVCRAIKNVDLDIRQVPGTALAQHPSGKIVYTPPEGQAVLREKLASLEKFLHGNDDHRSDHPHGRGALPVRGDPPLHRRQRPHGAHPQHALPDRQRSPRPADPLPEPLHQRASQRILRPPARRDDQGRVGGVAALHADGRGGDVAVDDGEDPRHRRPDGRNRRLT